MSIKVVTYNHCDFCGADTNIEYPSKRWFIVNGLEHACELCGHGMMDLLGRLKIPYKKACNMYTDRDVTGFGTIDYPKGERVSLSAVLDLAVKRFGRPG